MRAARADTDPMNRHDNERKARGLHALPGTPALEEAASPAPPGAEPGHSRGPMRGVYHISIVAELVETHPQTLRMYERMGLVSPQRTRNNIRLYSEADVERVRRIQHLTQDLGVNLAGVEVVFKLLNEMERMQAEAEARHSSLSQELQQLREQLGVLFGEARAVGERKGRA